MSEWIEEVRKKIEYIKSLSPEDRLDYLSALLDVHNIIAESVVGWASWLQKPKVMKQFNKEELDEILKDLIGLAELYCETDVKWTKKLDEKIEHKEEKKEYNYVR